jgi:hypothetical protein
MLREIFVWGSQVVYLAHYIISNSIGSAGLPVLTTKQSKRYHSESSNFSASENSLLRPQEADNDLCREPQNLVRQLTPRFLNITFSTLLSSDL